MRRGHGPAVYGYGWDWFSRCRAAADAADVATAKRERAARRLRRMEDLWDMAVAVHGTKDDITKHLDKLARE